MKRIDVSPTIRAVVYTRMSTAEQVDSPRVQEDNAKKYAEEQGWAIIGIYTDPATSRSEYVKRPDLYRMLADASDGKFDVVILRDIDRLGGDTSRNQLLISDLMDAGVRVDEYLSGQTLDLSSPTAKLMVNIKSFAAETERLKTATRTHESLAAKAGRGLVAGGAVYGYSRNPVVENGTRVRTEYTINQDEAPFVQEIFERHWKGGEGYRSLALDFNARRVPAPRAGKRGSGIWSARLVCDLANNERYFGKLRYGVMKKTYKRGTKVRVKREAKDIVLLDRPDLRLVSEEIQQLYISARKNLDASKTNDHAKPGPKARHLLAGIAKCGVCGGPMQGQSGRKGIRYYRCGRNRDQGTTVCSNNLQRPVTEADRAVVGSISRYLDEDVVARVIREVKKQIAIQGKKSNAELPRLEEERAKLLKEIDSLAEAVALSTNVPVLAKKLGERQERLNDLEASIRTMKTAPNVIDLELRRLEAATRERLANLHETMRGNIAQARQALQSVLEGPIVMTPRSDASGREYAITGRLSLGGALSSSPAPSPDQARGHVAYHRRPQWDSNPC